MKAQTKPSLSGSPRFSAERVKIYTVLAIFAAVVLVSAVFLIAPLARQIKQSSKALADAKANIYYSGKQAQELDNFKKNYPALKLNLDNLELVFADGKDPVDFIKFIEDSAADFNVEIKISQAAAADEKNQDVLNFQISSKGRFSGIVNFLDKLESGRYLAAVQNLTMNKPKISPDGKPVGSEQISANFLIKTIAK